MLYLVKDEFDRILRGRFDGLCGPVEHDEYIVWDIVYFPESYSVVRSELVLFSFILSLYQNYIVCKVLGGSPVEIRIDILCGDPVVEFKQWVEGLDPVYYSG